MDAAITTAWARRRRPWCGEGEGEELGRNGRVSELGEEVGSIPPTRMARGGSRAAGSCVARAAAAVEHLPACLAEPSSSLERWLGWAGRWAY